MLYSTSFGGNFWTPFKFQARLGIITVPRRRGVLYLLNTILARLRKSLVEFKAHFTSP